MPIGFNEASVDGRGLVPVVGGVHRSRLGRTRAWCPSDRLSAESRAAASSEPHSSPTRRPAGGARGEGDDAVAAAAGREREGTAAVPLPPVAAAAWPSRWLLVGTCARAWASSYRPAPWRGVAGLPSWNAIGWREEALAGKKALRCAARRSAEQDWWLPECMWIPSAPSPGHASAESSVTRRAASSFVWTEATARIDRSVPWSELYSPLRASLGTAVPPFAAKALRSVTEYSAGSLPSGMCPAILLGASLACSSYYISAASACPWAPSGPAAARALQ